MYHQYIENDINKMRNLEIKICMSTSLSIFNLKQFQNYKEKHEQIPYRKRNTSTLAKFPEKVKHLSVNTLNYHDTEAALQRCS